MIAMVLGLLAMIAIPILWVLYLAVMGFSRVKQEGALSRPALIMGYPVFAIGYLWDFLTNVFVVTFIFLDLPRQFTVSQRIQQYVDGANGWRKTLATWFAVNLLNPLSPGGPRIKV